MTRTRQRWSVGPRTIFFDDVASRTTLSKAVNDGRIRRLAPRVFTADRTTDLATIVRANCSQICSHYLPGAVIVDRSAAEDGDVGSGMLTVAADTSRKSIRLPGLEIRIRYGKPYESDSCWSHGLRMSSPARTLLDNLETSRSRGGRQSRTLSLDELEDWLARKYLAWGPARVTRIRGQARDLAQATGRFRHLSAIDELFERLTGGRPPRPRSGALLKDVAAGEPWDSRRLQLFGKVHDALQQMRPPEVPEWLPEPETLGSLPFYESYFSNHIEGTRFEPEEARHIVDTGRPPSERPADGHDILGTFRCVADTTRRAATSTDATELITLLKARHREIMGGRPEMRPGSWKMKQNRANGYEFVAPELVEGTLAKGLKRATDLQAGLARALYVMLIVTEVHPFTDGNGRVARVMMNAELSAVGAARIVIPKVYRNEYLSALRNVSVTGGDVTAYLRVMTYAWRWTAAMPWGDGAATEGQLIATNAFLDSTEAARTGRRLELP